MTDGRCVTDVAKAVNVTVRTGLIYGSFSARNMIYSRLSAPTKRATEPNLNDLETFSSNLLDITVGFVVNSFIRNVSFRLRSFGDILRHWTGLIENIKPGQIICTCTIGLHTFSTPAPCSVTLQVQGPRGLN